MASAIAHRAAQIPGECPTSSQNKRYNRVPIGAQGEPEHTNGLIRIHHIGDHT
jgi:hypothetical protein